MCGEHGFYAIYDSGLVVAGGPLVEEMPKSYLDGAKVLCRALGQFGTILRFWPADQDTASEFATLFKELRQAGRALSQFDHLIAAIARQHDLTLLTADGDFRDVPRLRTENWLT